jgi:hypothetical protein
MKSLGNLADDSEDVFSIIEFKSSGNFAAIRGSSPNFLIVGSSIEEVALKASRALQFYESMDL